MFDGLKRLFSTGTKSQPTPIALRRAKGSGGDWRRALEAKYEAAEHNRMTAHMYSVCMPSNEELANGKLATLRARSRWVCNNHALGTGFIKKLKRRIAGAGMSIQARLRDRQGKYMRAESSAQEAQWKMFAADMSVEGDSFRAFAKLAVETRFRDGEVFLVKSLNAAKRPFAREWQIIEGDQIVETADEWLRLNHAAPGNKVILGVEVNPAGRPVAYYIYTDGKTSSDAWAATRKFERVEASRVIHWMNKPRAGCTRGVPELTPVMLLWADEEEFRKATLTSAWAQACLTAFVTTKTPYEDMVAAGSVVQDETATSPRQFIEQLDPLSVKYLSGEEDVKFAEPKAAVNYTDFSTTVQRVGAAGLDFSYETVSRDFSKTNYSSGRQVALDDNGAFEEWAADCDEYVVKPIYLDFIDQLYFVHRALPLPNCQNVTAHYIQHPKPGWVDPEKEQRAWDAALNNDTASPIEVCAARGRDFYEVQEEIADAAQYRKALGIVPAAAVTPPPPRPERDEPEEEEVA